MQIIRSITKMQASSRHLSKKGKSIALVPTMGYLHKGHSALIKLAREEADVVIVTIFVNPAQFGPKEDFKKYPRDEKGDLKKIKAAGGNIVFIPKSKDIYPEDFQTYVTVEKLTKTLEGKHRPSHFRGVTTIVAKLFNICRPDVAIFGMKDYQQAIVLKQMTGDLGYPIKFIISPIVRERDGVAMSSRNKYFDKKQRRAARCLYYALHTALEMVSAGYKNTKTITSEMRAVIKSISPSAKIDYIAFTEYDTLKPLKKIKKGCVCSLAVVVHGVRLIDNWRL